MDNPTKPLDIEARELLARQLEVGLYHDDAERIKVAQDGLGVICAASAIAAISELLTRLREVEKTTINGVLSIKLRDANETICEQRALLEECIDTVKIVADSFYEDNEGTVVNDIPLHIRRRAASLIEKLEGMG